MTHTPEPLMSLAGDGHYTGDYNDVFATRRRGYWFVSYRGPGNVSVQVSKHRSEQRAVAAASCLVRKRIKARRERV